MISSAFMLEIDINIGGLALAGNEPLGRKSCRNRVDEVMPSRKQTQLLSTSPALTEAPPAALRDDRIYRQKNRA